MEADAKARELKEGQDMIAELEKLLFTPGNLERYFPQEYWEKVKNNFDLFDRDSDGYINLDEVFELLNSLDVDLPPRDVRILYNALTSNYDQKGLSDDQLRFILTKKIKDDDKYSELVAHFAMLDPDGTGVISDLEVFKEILMGKGLKFTEQEVDEFLEEANPKKDQQFNYRDFVGIVVDGLQKKGKTKKKGKKKGKKKKN